MADSTFLYGVEYLKYHIAVLNNRHQCFFGKIIKNTSGEREEHIVHLCYTSKFSFFRFHPFCLFSHLDMKWTLGLFCVVLLSE